MDGVSDFDPNLICNLTPTGICVLINLGKLAIVFEKQAFSKNDLYIFITKISYLWTG